MTAEAQAIEVPGGEPGIRSRTRIAWRPIGWAVLVALVIVWQLAAALGWYASPILPSPASIGAEWWSLAQAGTLWPALGQTLGDMLAGFVIGVVAGVVLGTLMARIRPLYGLLEPLVEIIRPIPVVALVPLLILFLGIGEELKVFAVALGAVFPALIATLAGVGGVPITLRQTAETFGLGPTAATLRVYLPAALPTIAVGVRTALSLSIVLAVLSEMIAGNTGIGYLVINAQQSLDVSSLYAQVVTLGVIGYLLNLLLNLLVRYAIPWGPDEQARTGRS